MTRIWQICTRLENGTGAKVHTLSKVSPPLRSIIHHRSTIIQDLRHCNLGGVDDPLLAGSRGGIRDDDQINSTVTTTSVLWMQMRSSSGLQTCFVFWFAFLFLRLQQILIASISCLILRLLLCSACTVLNCKSMWCMDARVPPTIQPRLGDMSLRKTRYRLAS